MDPNSGARRNAFDEVYVHQIWLPPDSPSALGLSESNKLQNQGYQNMGSAELVVGSVLGQELPPTLVCRWKSPMLITRLLCYVFGPVVSDTCLSTRVLECSFSARFCAEFIVWHTLAPHLGVLFLE